MMKRVVQDPPGSGRWISFQEWVRKQQVAENARIGQTQREQYDLTYRTGSSEKLPYDFSQ
jgi:hypothetical protein